MSGYNVTAHIKKRLEISHKINIVLTDKETQDIDKELGETECPKVIDKLASMSDEELYALVMKIRKKKIVIGVQ
jgi:hypothetical protein